MEEKKENEYCINCIFLERNDDRLCDICKQNNYEYYCTIDFAFVSQ